jgi:peptide-methionine (S)-S-oxide reductase
MTDKTSCDALLKIFWEGHDPTQGMRQGNASARSTARHLLDQRGAARRARSPRDMFQEQLAGAGYGQITTEILEAGPFYYAEDYHQQYLEANPNGYCGPGGSGVSCPIGVGVSAAGK